MTGGPWLEELLLVAGAIALAAFVARLAFRLALARLDVRRERERTLRELLARLDSPERAIAFLSSPEGRALLGEVSPARRRGQALLALAAAAAFGLAFGAALLVVAARTDPALTGDRDAAFAWGLLLCAAGAASGVLGLVVRALAPGRRGDGGDA